MKLYMLDLSGQGDRVVKLVKENVWNWVHLKDTPGRQGDETAWVDTAMPESVRKAIHDDDPHNEPIVTIGSYQNDRALHVCGEDAPYDEYSSVKKAIEWAANNGHEIVDEWEGCIY